MENLKKIIIEENKEILELINSKEYKLGRAIVEIKSKKSLSKILKIFRNYFFISCRKKHKVSKTKEYEMYKGEKIAVYTVLFGNYDKVKEPVLIDEECDYYIITDQYVSEDSVWKKMDVCNFNKYIEGLTNNEKNRFFKMYPFDLFPDYKYSIYVDTNVKIIGCLPDIINNINPITGIALHNHSHRDCIYEESKACIILGKTNKKDAKRQISKYRKEGFPKNYGMFECNVICRDHSNNICKVLMKKWWIDYMDNNTKRDQISLPYILWKNEIKYEQVGIIYNDMNLNPHFRRYNHHNQ